MYIEIDGEGFFSTAEQAEELTELAKNNRSQIKK